MLATVWTLGTPPKASKSQAWGDWSHPLALRRRLEWAEGMVCLIKAFWEELCFSTEVRVVSHHSAQLSRRCPPRVARAQSACDGGHVHADTAAGWHLCSRGRFAGGRVPSAVTPSSPSSRNSAEPKPGDSQVFTAERGQLSSVCCPVEAFRNVFIR